SARENRRIDTFELPAGITRPRNVIVMVLESVGAKYLSLYGSQYPTTPNLSAEASHALVFDNFYANAPYTYCSFTVINYSIYPALPWCFAPYYVRPTLASRLRALGRRTTYIHSGDLDWGGGRWILERSGFNV